MNKALIVLILTLFLPTVVFADEEKLRGPAPGNFVVPEADVDPFPASGGSRSNGGSSSSGAENPSSFYGGINAVKDIAKTNKLAPARSSKEILQTIVKWLLSLIGTIAVISLLYGGYLYISSQGEEGQVEKAKNIMLYSVIGIIIIGLSAVVVNVVINVATT